MKNLLTLAIGLGLTLSVQAQIKFQEGTWAETKAKAKKEKKMIFIDAYTTWCGPCKWLSANVFTDKTVGEYHNEKFVNYKMDMEKGEGPAFAQEFGINAYPTLLYFTKDGQIAHRSVGAFPAEQLLANSKNALDPDKQFYTLLKKYEKGDRKPDFLRSVALAAKSADVEKAPEIMTEFMKTLKKEDWSKPENADFVVAAVKGFDSEAFQYMEKNADKFSKEQFTSAMEQSLDFEIGKAIKNKDEAAIKVMQEKVSKYMSEQAAKINPMIAEYYYKGTGNTAKATEIGEAKLAESTDWSELNQQAWAYFEKETDKEKLTKALGWAKKSVGIEENYFNIDTYANLLYKLGDKKEALIWVKKAIELGEKAGEDTSSSQGLLKKIHEDK